MPDIALCQNDDCPVKAECYRYTATPSQYQYYAAFKYEDGCENFVDNKPNK